MSGRTSVRYLPVAREVLARVGDTLLDAALDNGIEIQHECGGNCACTTCHVFVEHPRGALSGMEEVEVDRISTAEGRCANSRLACQAIILGDGVVVTIVVSD